MANQQGERQNDDALLYGLLALISAILVYALWFAFHEQIIYYTLKLAWVILGFLSLGPLEDIFYPVRKELSEAALYAEHIPFLEFLRLSAMGYIVFSPLALIWIFFEFLSTLNDPKQATKRAMTLDRLRKIMNSHSTATIPLDGYPNLLKNNPEEHRSALSPLEFAKENELLNRRLLDRPKAEAVFAKQLGERTNEINSLPPHQKALFTVFASRLFGKDRQESQDLLDALNRSCSKTGYPDFSIIQKAFSVYSKNPEIDVWLKSHKYAPTLLYAMHNEAMKYGKLPSSYFRWLKGLDRTLWYTLNNSGRKVSWCECGGVFCQAEWEMFAKNKKGTLKGVHVTPAVDALEQWLSNVGAIVKPITEGED